MSLSLSLSLAGDITQKGYEKKRSKLIGAFFPQAPGNTDIPSPVHSALFTKHRVGIVLEIWIIITWKREEVAQNQNGREKQNQGKQKVVECGEVANKQHVSN